MISNSLMRVQPDHPSSGGRPDPATRALASSWPGRQPLPPANPARSNPFKKHPAITDLKGDMPAGRTTSRFILARDGLRLRGSPCSDVTEPTPWCSIVATRDKQYEQYVSSEVRHTCASRESVI